MSSSRFVAEFASVKKAEAAVSRFIHRSLGVGGFLDKHPKLSRFIAHIPGASKFLPLPTVAALPRVAPVYNARAQKPRPPTFRM